MANAIYSLSLERLKKSYEEQLSGLFDFEANFELSKSNSKYDLQLWEVCNKSYHRNISALC